MALSRCVSRSHAPVLISPLLSPSSSSSLAVIKWKRREIADGNALPFRASRCRLVVRSSAGFGEWVKKPAAETAAPSVSDVLWPSAGAFLAMAALGRLDQMVSSRGLSLTIAPLGAVCAVLFSTPNAPAAQKYNMFVAQIGCAAIGVLALSIFGPGWLARSTALAASIAFMIITGATHPPAASLPLLFIDGAKFHHLHFWYTLFPGATGCILLCLIQEIVTYMKTNYRF